MAGKFTALVVDDYAQNRHIFNHVLQEAGYEVFLAENGYEAVEVLKTQKIQLIMLDIQMPLMDGTTFLHFLRARPKLRDIKVIVVTANPEVVTERVQKLADYVMYKPIDIDEMVQFTTRIKKTLAV